MTNDKVLDLNFLALENQDFKFQIWRRECIPNEKKPGERVKEYKLPDEQGNYKYYWVSFEKFENAEMFQVNSSHNLHLTKSYLFTLLKNRLEEQNVKFEKGAKKFASSRIYVVVETTEYGRKTIFFEPYYLKTVKKFGFLIDYKFLKNQDKPFSKEVQRLSFSLDDNYRSNISYHVDKYSYIKEYLKQHLSLISPLAENIIISKDFEKLDYKILEAGTYIFDKKGKNDSQFEGIKRYGPYEKIKNANSIKYVYIYLEDHQDYVRELVKALNGESFETFKGLNILGMPSQTKENTTSIPIKSFDIDPSDVLSQNKIDRNSIIIAIFLQKEEEFYYRLKSYCLLKDIPLQAVYLGTIIDENRLKWAVSGIALQMFAKLGGTPWIVETEGTNCLIVGIGEAIEKEAQDKLNKFFAYAVLLDASGKFLSIEPLAYSSKDEYLKKVSENVSKILEEYSDYKRIVFHVPEKIQHETIEKMKEILISSNKDIELYIVRVNDDSKFFGYDTNNNSLIPYKGSYMRLSDKEFLLWTEGLNYNDPKPVKRYGNPIYIDFWYSNQSETNFELFLQDILSLSGANYRGFRAKSLPVSMFYPKLIANFYKNFKKINLQIEKSNRPWFL